MIGFFNSIPTKIEINGPILSFTGSNTLQPLSTSFCNGGSAGFVGYATATFPIQSPVNPAENTGYIQYRWYEVGVGELTDSANVVGSATTFLTLSNLRSPQDNGRQFFLRADYVNSAYAIGRSTGNAINESLDSNTATLGVRPNIGITTQPTNKSAAQGQTTTFNIGANATDNSNTSLTYKWYANGILLNNGKNSVTTYPSPSPTQTQTVTIPGWNGAGIYLDLVQFVGNVNVTISTTEESGIFHYINIPGVANIPENLGRRTYTLQGGRIYGPCSAPNGNLYIGNETPVGGTNVLVVEEGGDDWNDMILYVNSGFFKRYNTAPQTTTIIAGVTTAYMTVTDSLGRSSEINLSNITSLSSFNAGEVYTITTNTNVQVEAFLRGGKGGTSTYLRSVEGGTGGTASGKITFLAGQTYKVVRASAASNSTAGLPGGGNGDGGGGGGGYTGIFNTSQTQANAILIAGGGGGGANDPETGLAGGGTTGGNGQAGNKGGTQSAGGVGDNHAGNRPGFAGSALQGGQGAAGGGGGYYGGGGGGGYPGCCDDWAGGGGSGYINPTLVTNGTFTATAKNNASSTDGILILDILSVGSIASTPVTGTLTVSGATTPNLSVSCDTLTTLAISCLVSHPTACNSPLLSDTVSFQVVNANQILKIERIAQSGSSTATLTTHNLYSQGAYTFSDTSNTFPIFSFYAAERDLDVFIDLYGGVGLNNGTRTGGQGGVSTIRLTLRKDVEYVLAGLSVNSPLFLYRQSTLIAVVGRGGSAGTNGNGGNGGGVNVSGGVGSGNGAGSGGALISPGQLTTTGIFGSAAVTSALRSGDSNATAPNGGRALSCAKGNYWQGTSPCSNMGTIQFRVADGTLITNSATIARGFKAGYGIRQTAGAGLNNGGNGGEGATGGAGGSSGAGGGGGSGYTDGSVTIISTQQGGNTGSTRMVIRTALV